jgi:5-methylcytosine-specific restriction endonuclease McrA
MTSTPRRSTTIRDRHRAVIRAKQAECGICGQPIDYSLPYLHPWSFVVDHFIPLARGGADVLENLQAAHRACNRWKGDKIDSPRVEPVTTSRRW